MDPCVEPPDWHIWLHPWFAGREEGDSKPLSFSSSLKEYWQVLQVKRKSTLICQTRAEQHKETRKTSRGTQAYSLQPEPLSSACCQAQPNSLLVREMGKWHFPMLPMGLPMAQTLQSVTDGPVPPIASMVSVLDSIFHWFSQSGAVTNRQLQRDTVEFLSPKTDSNSISRNLGSGKRGRPGASNSAASWRSLDYLDEKMTI